mmetsp:Transcript_20368/g.52891  ORF Transcript_20368/g.52891 Transcript_20368/m.52891 type:complete len:373 (-) Transcript_20368:215-1333(-)
MALLIAVAVVGTLAQTAGAARSWGPCDIYAAAGSPCVAAHSTIRALYAAYDGPLYLVNRSSDQATMVVKVDPSTGFAEAGAQRAFCPSSTKCEVERIFDQSPRGNHLDKVVVDPLNNPHEQPVTGIDPMSEELTIAGHAVYSAYFEGGEHRGNGTQGFRAETTMGVAQNDTAESMYAIVSGTHYNGNCCFDYGNSEGNHDKPHPHPEGGDGKMEAICFGSSLSGGSSWSKGLGDGPWVRADLEMGVWAGNRRGNHSVPAVNPLNTPINTTFVTAMLKGRSGNWALKHGNAQSGALTTLFDGPRPLGYEVMSKQGAIVLGIGGDGSNGGVGTFYEGAMTANYTSDKTDEQVQASIVAVYGHAVIATAPIRVHD